MGIAAGGNINPDKGGVSMFEPIGGSAPKYTGQGVINPLAAICSMQMMLETLGEDKAAAKIEALGLDAIRVRSEPVSVGASVLQIGRC